MAQTKRAAHAAAPQDILVTDYGSVIGESLLECRNRMIFARSATFLKPAKDIFVPFTNALGL
jgi:hypothetical protein